MDYVEGMNTLTHTKKSIPILGLIGILAFSGWCLVQRFQHSKTPQLREMRDPEGCIARGLRIEEHFDGRRLFSLSADSLRVVGKKAGFFRLGFWKIAKFENLSIDFYEHPRGTEIQDSKGRVIEGAGFPDLGDLFMRNDKLKRLIPKRIRGVECSNVRINLFQDGKIVSSIAANKATLDSRGRRLVFKGGVRIASDNGKTLECGKITWLADTRRFVTSEQYVLKRKEQVISGEGLETDFELEKILLTEGRRG